MMAWASNFFTMFKYYMEALNHLLWVLYTYMLYTSLEECFQRERHKEADQEYSMTLGVILETLKPSTTLLAL